LKIELKLSCTIRKRTYGRLDGQTTDGRTQRYSISSGRYERGCITREDWYGPN